MSSLSELKKGFARDLFDGRDMVWVRKHKACISCTKPFFSPAGAPVHQSEVPAEDWREGLVYSQAGLDELHISGMCKFCYDNMTTGK